MEDESCQLVTRYSDHRRDLADLCLIRISELYPRHVVVTVDESDFPVYRRNNAKSNPIACAAAPWAHRIKISAVRLVALVKAFSFFEGWFASN